MTKKKNKVNFKNVDSPEHYVRSETTLENIECIDAMVAVFGLEHTQKYAEIAAFKYLWRMNKKNENSDEDKHKAIWYLRFSMNDDPRNGADVREDAEFSQEEEDNNATITGQAYKDLPEEEDAF